jgi:prolyl-tRNA editing enzyme YbaK/EbsC (Cys-tRNA(Pro) deacylase)
MSEQEVNKIKKIFSDLSISPQYLEHEPVITSVDAAKTRGFELKQGIKAIVFTNGKGDFVVTDVPADKKVDQKLVATAVGWSKGSIRIATEQEVLEQTGCLIGSVPPFGHKNPLKIFYDEKVFENEFNAFNIGLRTHSVKIKTDDVRKTFQQLNLIKGNFIKD